MFHVPAHKNVTNPAAQRPAARVTKHAAPAKSWNYAACEKLARDLALSSVA